jgi:hypothetical protein
MVVGELPTHQAAHLAVAMDVTDARTDPITWAPSWSQQTSGSNAVAPGTIQTRVWHSQEGGADRFRQLYPLGSEWGLAWLYFSGRTCASGPG